jgi:hypothetical protein
MLLRLFHRIGEFQHLRLSLLFKKTFEGLLVMSSPLSKEEENVVAVLNFGRLNIMERPQNFLQCYRKGFMLHLE